MTDPSMSDGKDGGDEATRPVSPTAVTVTEVDAVAEVDEATRPPSTTPVTVTTEIPAEVPAESKEVHAHAHANARARMRKDPSNVAPNTPPNAAELGVHTLKSHGWCG